MGRVEASRSLAQRVYHDHGGGDRAGAVERAPQRVREQYGPQPPSLTFPRDCQATDQRRAHQRLPWDVLAHRLWHITLTDRHGAKRVVAQHLGRLADLTLGARDQERLGIRHKVHDSLSLHKVERRLSPWAQRNIQLWTKPGRGLAGYGKTV